MTTRYHAALNAMLNAMIQFSGAAREVDAAAKAIEAATPPIKLPFYPADATPDDEKIARAAVERMREVLAALLRDVPNMGELIALPTVDAAKGQS